jgi:hypothetical protein
VPDFMPLNWHPIATLFRNPLYFLLKVSDCFGISTNFAGLFPAPSPKITFIAFSIHCSQELCKLMATFPQMISIPAHAGMGK